MRRGGEDVDVAFDPGDCKLLVAVGAGRGTFYIDEHLEFVVCSELAEHGLDDSDIAKHDDAWPSTWPAVQNPDPEKPALSPSIDRIWSGRAMDLGFLCADAEASLRSDVGTAIGALLIRPHEFRSACRGRQVLDQKRRLVEALLVSRGWVPDQGDGGR